MESNASLVGAGIQPNNLFALNPNPSGMIGKVIKELFKSKGNPITTAESIASDIKTILSSGSTTGDRILAGISLVSPIDHKDVKAVKSLVTKSGKPRIRVKDVSEPGAKQPNYEVNWTKEQFENHLTGNGYSNSTIPTKKGPISVLSKNGNKEYTTRDFSTSTDGPTGEMFKSGEKAAKIRFKRDEE